MEISDWISLSSVVVGVIGIIVGYIGSKELKVANELKVKIEELEIKVDKIKINKSQVAGIINNSGLNLADTEIIANRLVNEKTKNIPKITYLKTEPEVVEPNEIVYVYEDDNK